MRTRQLLVVALAVVPWLSLIPDAVARDLTFEDRVNAQEAIERVYYSHQIGATKPFEEAVPRAVLEDRVRTYLKESVALETYWKTPITAQALTRELERMTRHTRLPDRLREIDSALGNDPQLLLECLARPALADRLARNFFAFDQTIHETEKQQAQVLRDFLQQGEISINENHPLRVVFTYAKGESERPSSTRRAMAEGEDDITTPRRVTLEPDAYTLTRTAAPAQVGAIGPVAEEREAFVIQVVLGETPTSFSLAAYAVPKISWDEWWASLAPGLDGSVISSVEGPDLSMAAPDCELGDSWNNGILDDLPDTRAMHTAVWTGTEMIVWGGFHNGSRLNTGGRYDPATDTWSPTSTTNAPEARWSHVAVWTGSQMIVWGGDGTTNLNSGGRYDPSTDTWSATSSINSPSGRFYHTAVWTGTQMIIWGGNPFLNSGGRYDPATDSWAPTASQGAPEGRQFHSAIWTGTRMIVWGGDSGSRILNSGGLYDPTADAWSPTTTMGAPSIVGTHTAVWTGTRMIIWSSDAHKVGALYDPNVDSWLGISPVNAPSPRSGYTAVWTGTEMIIWGGADLGGAEKNTGGRYDPSQDVWVPTSTSNAPERRQGHTAVWTGTLMLVWGAVESTGGRYDPTTDTWTPTATTSGPTGRLGNSAVWTGTEMIVWGGAGAAGFSTSGGRYNPTVDSWSPTTMTNAPAGRNEHSAVWTGTEMIVWGGSANGGVAFNTGGRYDPVLDMWTSSATANAPAARVGHTAVWTGNRMVIWGGSNFSGNLNTGGRYDPATDTWSQTSVVNVPAKRANHTAVWTGTRMITWGGFGSARLNSGGIYNPATDIWSPTSNTNAPTARLNHTAIWTGTQMIVWGGSGLTSSGGVFFSSGGRYDPNADTWTATATAGAPAGRIEHTAVWTGNQMIVWGGIPGTSSGPQSGGRYDPALDAWSPISTINSPLVRAAHTAVWTGSEMIVWGGSTSQLGGDYLRSGGRYRPEPFFGAPTADAGPDSGVECAAAVGTVVQLGGSGTGCGPLTLTWAGPFAEGGGSVSGSDPAVTLPLGQSAITLRVDDAHGQSATDAVLVTVRDTTPPTLTCPTVAPSECSSSAGAAVKAVATATDVCSAKVTLLNSQTPNGGDGSGTYPLGSTPVTFTAQDPSGNIATCSAPVTVKDTTPPTLTVVADPASLWPPNHELVSVNVAGQLRDVCDPNPAVTLVSVTSSEPDDAPGMGDGNTTGDIAGAELGTADGQVDLRAERNGTGPGRVYQLTYQAVDASGNMTPAFAVVTVPHDQGSGPEPLLMRLEPDGTPGMVRIYWAGIPGALGYDVISGDLSQAKAENGQLSLGNIRVLARGTTETALTEDPNSMMPATGMAIFYLIQSRTDRGGGGYGTESAPWPRVPASCDEGCP